MVLILGDIWTHVSQLCCRRCRNWSGKAAAGVGGTRAQPHDLRPDLCYGCGKRVWQHTARMSLLQLCQP